MNCSNRLSREHIISNCLLEDSITVQGFSWCREKKSIGSANFVSKHLCEYHNNLLSPTDDEILKYVDTIKNFNALSKKIANEGFHLKKIPVRFILDGSLLEKWFCKTLMNVSLVNEREVIIPYEAILSFLFLDKKFERPYGLSVAARVTQEIIMGPRIEITPVLNIREDGIKELAGGLFIVRGFYFILLLPCSREPFKDNKFTLNIADSTQRWDDLQLNWHHKEINQFWKRGRKKYKTHLIHFEW